MGFDWESLAETHGYHAARSSHPSFTGFADDFYGAVSSVVSGIALELGASVMYNLLERIDPIDWALEFAKSKRRRANVPRLPSILDTLKEASPEQMYLADVDESVNLNQIDKQLVPVTIVKANGQYYVQCAYVKSIRVVVNSTTSYSVSAYIPENPTDTSRNSFEELDRNTLAKTNRFVVVNATGYAYTFDPQIEIPVNRVVPFNFIRIDTTDVVNDYFSCTIQYDVVRMTPLEYWNIVMTQYTVDLDSWFPLYSLVAHAYNWNIKQISMA